MPQAALTTLTHHIDIDWLLVQAFVSQNCIASSKWPVATPRRFLSLRSAAPVDRNILDQQEAAAAERAACLLSAAGADSEMALLDQYAKLI
jgi:hypothetical protein